MNYETTRREFLTTASLATAGIFLGARVLPADSSEPANSFITNSYASSEMQQLAAQAVDAAKSAGASYADVRVSEWHQLNPSLVRVLLYTEFTYGVRALVDGQWGFAYGREATSDGVVRCTNQAVASARLAARLMSRSLAISGAANSDWVPASAENGEWRTPIKIDPFSVPIQQHAELQQSVARVVESVPGADGSFETNWTKETRVFASSAGSVITQHFHQMEPNTSAVARARYGRSQMPFSVPVLKLGASGGYELLTETDLAEQFKVAAEDALMLARLPRRVLDVGRYPIVMDGHILGKVVGTLVGPALEMDRVLGHEANASGTSPWTVASLGTRVSSPLFTITGSRALPFITAAKWDDDGCPTQEHVVIKDGILKDYHTSAETAGALKRWYEKEGRPLRSNGCSVASEADQPPFVQCPHLNVTAGKEQKSLDDLLREMKRGVVALNSGYLRTDQQLVSGSMESEWSGIFEVSGGKIIRRLSGMALRFNTRSLLHGISALGDASTMQNVGINTTKGRTWSPVGRSATAPGALFKEVDVISIPRN